MKIADRKPVLNVAQVRALPQFGKLNARQQKFIVLLSANAEPLAAVYGAYNCKSRRSGERFLYGLLTRPSMQSVLNLLYGRDNKDSFLERIEELLRKGNRVTAAEIAAITLHGVANGFLPADYSPTAELAKLGKV